MTTMFCPKHRIAACIALFLLLLAGCATNPVTGKRELRLVSEAQEMRMGRQHYLASQQMQGGAYNVDPELTRYVREVGAKLARVSDRGLAYEFVVLNNSTPNAWALPGGKIAVNRGLLVELDNEAELAAVLGHEIVHAAARHGAKNVERGMLLQGAVAVADMAAQDSDYAALIVGGAGLAAGLLAQTYSRKAEREADFYGIQYMARAGYDPQAAVSLQEVFVQLSADRSEPWLSGLFASHPPSAERVENNRLTAAALPPQGELHRERYQQKTAHLKRTQAAYEAYDEGRQALSKGRIQEALGLAREALQTEPREAQFHALLGDVRFTQKRYREALPHYDQAITHHEAFFHFRVQRGLTHQQLGNLGAARVDFERSMDLLATATAANALGDIALASGNPERALQYFRAAAASDSSVGHQAATSLALLDLPRRPDAYLEARLGLDQQGYVTIEVINPTPVTVQEVGVLAYFPDAVEASVEPTIHGAFPTRRALRTGVDELAGQIGKLVDAVRQFESLGDRVQTTYTIQRAIPPQQYVIVSTGLGPVDDPDILRRFHIVVDRANVTP